MVEPTCKLCDGELKSIGGYHYCDNCNQMQHEICDDYRPLIRQMNKGKQLQRCTINQNCVPVEWHDVDEISYTFASDRYRTIAKQGATNE